MDLSGSLHHIDPDFGLASHTICVDIDAEIGGLIHRIMAGHSEVVLISMCNPVQPVILEWENLVHRKNGHG